VRIHDFEHGSNDEFRTYATAVIASLRAERDLERKAHEQTRHHAKYRIIAIEAQLARRDAELEACITHADDFLQQGGNQKHLSRVHEAGGNQRNDCGRLSTEEAIQVMEATSAKNKVLEQEVQNLFKRVRSQLPSVRLHVLNRRNSWRRLDKRHPEQHPRHYMKNLAARIALPSTQLHLLRPAPYPPHPCQRMTPFTHPPPNTTPNQYRI
jgi:hypothetical protein